MSKPETQAPPQTTTNPNLGTDPLVWAVLVLYRRWWALVIAAIVGGALAWFASPSAPPSWVATAQLYIQERPVVAGGLQEPINAVAYRSLLLSGQMQGAVGADARLSANVEVTQDTNFGKNYSPILQVAVSAPTKEAATESRTAWREAFLDEYGDLATQPAQERLARLEDRLAQQEEIIRVARIEEETKQATLRPLLLERARLEIARSSLKISFNESPVPRPRAQVYTRDRVVAQDSSIVSGDHEPWNIDFVPREARTTGETEVSDELSAQIAKAVAEFKLAQLRRLKAEAEYFEIARHAETNRLLIAGATGTGPEGENTPDSAANAFEAADVTWLEGPAPRRVTPAKSPLLALLGAGAAFALVAAFLLLSALNILSKE